MTATALVCRPADNPNPQPRKDNGEVAWNAWLDQAGYQGVDERDTYPFGRDRPGRKAKAITPDRRLETIAGRPVDPAGPRIYIEHTEADLYITAEQLPQRVRDKNRRYSSSRRSHITPAEYLERKYRRIARAEQLYGIIIILVPHALQQAIQAEPDLLLRLINAKLRRDFVRLSRFFPELTACPQYRN